MPKMLAATKQEQEPIFTKGVHEALRFAFNFQHGNVKEPPVSILQGDSKTGRGLGGIDGAAQAGMILAEVGQMAEERQAILAGRFTDQAIPCPCERPCCVGYTDNPKWAAAVEVLVDYILTNSGGSRISHYHLRRASVLRYFGVRRSFREVAAQCKVKPDTASAHHNLAVQCLSGLEKIARYEIEDRLRKAGVIPDWKL